MTLNPLNKRLESFLKGGSRREEAQTSFSLLSTLHPQPTDQSLLTSAATTDVGASKPALSARALVWWHQAQQQSPRGFTVGVLMAAVALAIAHYTFGDWVIYPEVALWKQRAFWAVVPTVVGVPLLHWIVWTVVSLGRLKPATVILVAAATLCLGDLVWYLVWLNLKAVGLDYKRFVDYWDWWAYWLPVVVVAGNLFLARRWWQMFRPAKSREARTYTRPELIIRGAAVVLGWCAVMLTAIHLLLPRMAVNDFTLSIADAFLVQDEWRADYDFVVRSSVSRGKRLGAILAHPELAHLQRHHFYPALDESVYQQFVLSPVVDRLPLSEWDWRRTLWENFYPRVRREHDPALAAQTVVRYLRERVGIDPTYSYRVGVETIWTQQMTDEIGFERIYVAALRSVGIAARVNAGQRAELWTGNAWHEAPRPIVASWSTSGETKR
jgi:Transglutaminase-like superfamily